MGAMLLCVLSGQLRRRPPRFAAGRSHVCRVTSSPRDDRGFSLIEVLVTVTLIALVMVPMGELFFQTQSVASDNSARQDSAGIATSIISDIANAPYGIVGLTAAHTDQAEAKLSSYYSSAYNTAVYQAGTSVSCSSGCGSYYFGGTAADQQLVTIGSGQTDLYHDFTVGTNAVPFEGYLTGVKSGTWTFTVTTRVSWVSTNVPACPGNGGSTLVNQAEKKVTVSVSTRSVTSGTVSVTENSIVYPGGLSAYAGSSFSSSGVPSAPVVSAPTVSSTTGQINISWAVPAIGYGSCYSVSWIDTNQNVYTTGMLASSYTLLSSGTGSGYLTPPPPAGTSGTAVFAVGNLTQADPFTFFVTAYSANGVESAQSADTASAISPSGPIITGLSPSYGPNGASTSVTVTGFGLASSDTFTFGTGKLGTVVSCAGTTSCVVTTPTNGTGLVNVIATNTLGVGSPPTSDNLFSFEPEVTGLSPASGPAAGGTVVTITGTNFVGVTNVSFGGVAAATFSCSSATTCKATSPAGTSGTVSDVTVTGSGGTSFTSNADKFTYT